MIEYYIVDLKDESSVCRREAAYHGRRGPSPLCIYANPPLSLRPLERSTFTHELRLQTPAQPRELFYRGEQDLARVCSIGRTRLAKYLVSMGQNISNVLEARLEYLGEFWRISMVVHSMQAEAMQAVSSSPEPLSSAGYEGSVVFVAPDCIRRRTSMIAPVYSSI